jgi:small subunit ribosomal protein S2
MKDLLESGVHFGHRSSRWNPKMAPYIYGKRNLIHIIDLQATVRGLIRACHFLTRITAAGEKVLVVGTKRQAKNVVISEARRCAMPYVAERWLGGTLTNFATIRSRLKSLNEIEEMERDGKIDLFNKKEISRIMREKRKLVRNLDGIRELERLPGAVVVIDPEQETNAVKEAIKLGIPTIGIVDTNGDPSLLDIAIPANDDAMRSIKILLAKMCEAIIRGRSSYKERAAVEERKRRDTAPTARERAEARGAGDRGPERGGERGGRGGPRRGRGSRVLTQGPRIVTSKRPAPEEEAPSEPEKAPTTESETAEAAPKAPAAEPKPKKTEAPPPSDTAPEGKSDDKPEQQAAAKESEAAGGSSS